jgi:hypothetical protein
MCMPYYLVDIYQCFGGAYHLHLEVGAVVATVCSSKMLVTHCNMWEGVDLHQYCCENHISCIVSLFCLSTGILYSSAVLSLSKQSFGSFSNAVSAMSSLHLVLSLVFPNKVLKASIMLVVLWATRTYITFAVKVSSIRMTQMSLQEQKNWWLHIT